MCRGPAMQGVDHRDYRVLISDCCGAADAHDAHELLDAAPSSSERLARLREGRTAELPSIQRETVEKYASNFAAVYDEFVQRVGSFAHV